MANNIEKCSFLIPKEVNYKEEDLCMKDKHRHPDGSTRMCAEIKDCDYKREKDEQKR